MPLNPQHFNDLVTPALRTTSKIIAERFGKRHADVLRAIRDMVEKEPVWGQRNFASFKNNDLTGESTSHYEMTRDGYSMLVMGFTGEKAMEWKIRFLEAFNKMEAILKAQSQPVAIDLNDPAQLMPLLASYTQRTQIAEAKVEVMAPKADAFDVLDASEGSMTVREAAKVLEVPERKFIRWLETRGWAFRQNGVGQLQAYVDKRNAGYLTHKPRTYFDERVGENVTKPQMMVTAKGLARLAAVFSKEGAPK
ncbi:Rha family transcriptional regulator [Falsirhodobacter xinxiangensis]|uniref:Rha family transcriptional regulator n=1 Tax=Falsirhodobacter xinxiangensis TaxID=2530049 RepID=UPI001FEA63C0|nr:phage regulatory protein/antirepressor Ant [Rhodobacter xinxiangensis]